MSRKIVKRTKLQIPYCCRFLLEKEIDNMKVVVCSPSYVLLVPNKKVLLVLDGCSSEVERSWPSCKIALVKKMHK